ncbi:hypothetical protein MNV_20017 [Candidatus Methanoperedens nitroreducens]|uniref:Transposase n=1 Tax=Candidatus Methanoperedens nitratireducens TaxID=1392998 RepID=A0A284VMX1_9EURY|nr:hypothetical protein MNV_20017 [Candidatus Methanoperedens nitroreducens]
MAKEMGKVNKNRIESLVSEIDIELRKLPPNERAKLAANQVNVWKRKFRKVYLKYRFC